MKYRSLIELYKQGKLDEIKKEEIEDAIEKHKAISDYIIEELDEEWEKSFTIEKDAKDNSPKYECTEKNFVKQINQSIRRAFFKMGAVITVILLSFIMFWIFGASPLISSFYYKPDKMYAGEDWEYNQMSLDWSVYSELMRPGKRRNNIVVKDDGFGKYSFTILQNVSHGEKLQDISGYIDKNKIELYNNDIVKCFPINYFAYTQLNATMSVIEQENSPDFFWYGQSQKLAKKELKKLENNKFYLGYVSFNNILNFDEFISIVKKGDYSVEWCGITYDSSYLEPIGYTMDTSGAILDAHTENNYPNLSFWTSDNAFPSEEDTSYNENWCKTHLISLLKYALEHPEPAKIFDANPDTLKDAKKYIEANGLHYYGMVIYAKKTQLLKLAEEDNVYGIVTTELE